MSDLAAKAAEAMREASDGIARIEELLEIPDDERGFDFGTINRAIGELRAERGRLAIEIARLSAPRRPRQAGRGGVSMARGDIQPFPDMLSATPVSEWVIEIDEPVELFIEHENLRYCRPEDADRWRGWFAARWIDFNGGGWTWHGLVGVVTHVRPIVPGDDPPGYRKAA